MNQTVATESVAKNARGFTPFLMSDDASMETWESYHALVLAYIDAELEIKHFSDHRRELRELLEQSGFHAIAKLRKQPVLTSYGDEEFDELLYILAEAGFGEIALLADRAREQQLSNLRSHKPRTPTEAKRELIAKLERLGQSPNSNEAATALARAEELKVKYEIDSSDPFDFDLEELYAPIVPTTTNALTSAVENAWHRIRVLGDRYYPLVEDPEPSFQRLCRRSEALLGLILSHPIRQARHEPIVVKRRP